MERQQQDQQKARNANYAVVLGPASFLETATGARLCFPTLPLELI